ncbi:MAG: hypothetical protein VBE63_14740 [Lamprobacter sp.]|uniref:hypothetical protein n=1 Tax=Lamprobacter sp. TaxID=3100796 RepID=UPI002B25A179|nr:hypothetical protein [Lamprobacter sp.]MEA3641179.1 hypothetical protein [Lamprobacter sp.]
MFYIKVFLFLFLFVTAGMAQADTFDFPSESICKEELMNLKRQAETWVDIRYCQVESAGSEIFCKKTNGKVAHAKCSGSLFATSGFR